ncbi:helix-turn-helix domain-containing protein [Streptomyces sp. P1-3]|uniref:helix-turn-helix domain-containing protein n=1 Tax=Streptomyces sp. P1-3 TaxID=3421658 RepID=UPI003D35FB27
MLADELARLRGASGLSLRELADKVGWDYTHVHSLEKGRNLGGPEVIEALDTVYGTTPMLMLLWELAKDGATFREKYVRYMELEAEALAIEHYTGNFVPGLLQTEAYARALLWSTPHRPENLAELEEQLEARMGRKEVLRREPAPYLRAILDEAVLRRPLLDPEEWHAQLAYLVEAASLPHVTVRILPYSVGLHDLVGGSLTIFRRPDDRTAAFMESSKGGELTEEPTAIERLRLSYDAVQDLALSPRDSVAFINQLMEDGAPCDPSAST